MKIPRINIVIPANQNTHRQFLYNEMLDFLNKNKLGGEFTNEHIKFRSMPEVLTTSLEKLGINFERIA